MAILDSHLDDNTDNESQINDEYPAKLPESDTDSDEEPGIIVTVQGNGTIKHNYTPVSPKTDSTTKTHTKKFVPPDGGYGWVVVVASFLIQSITGSVGYIQGMLYPEFLTAFGAGTVTTAWVSSIQIAVWFTGGMIAGPLVQTIGSRKVCWIGSFIITISLFISSQAVHISMLFIFYGVFCGLGMSFIFFPAVIIIQQYFVKRRAIAVAIANSGAPFGGFVMPPLCDFLLQTYGWRGTLMMMAGITAQVLVISYFFKPLPKNEPSKTAIKKNEEQQQSKGTADKSKKKTLESYITQSVMSISQIAKEPSKGTKFLKRLCDVSLLKNVNMSFDMFAYGFYSFGFIVPSMFLPLKARANGIPHPKPTILLSIIGISDVVGRFVSGFVGQAIGQKRLVHYMISMFMGGIATASSSLLGVFPALALYACIFGLSTGMTRAYSSIVLTDMLGLENLPKAYGFKLFLNGFTVLASAPFAAFIMNSTNSIDISFLVIGTIQAMGGVTIFILLILRRYGCAPVRQSWL